jgi:hypothetical protein
MIIERDKLQVITLQGIKLTEEQSKQYRFLNDAIANASEETKRFAFAQANMPGDEKMQLFTDKYVALQQAIGSGLENTMKIRTGVAKKEDQLNDEALKKENIYWKAVLKMRQNIRDVEIEMSAYYRKAKEDRDKLWKQEVSDLDAKIKLTREKQLADLASQSVINENDILAQFEIEKNKNEILRRNEIDGALTTGASVELINKKYAQNDIDLDKKKQQAKLDLAADFFGNLSTIFGKQTALGKAAAIAETTINTYAAATAAYKSLAAIPIVGVPLGIAAAAAAIAAGLANVRQIVKVNTKLYEGGYTGPGGKYQPAGIVHAGEWVAPADMVMSPATGPIIEALEYQRANSMLGYANGGGPGINASGAAGSSSALIGSDPELKALIRENLRINKMLLRDGVKNNWPWQDVDNMRKGLNRLEEIEGDVTM